MTNRWIKGRIFPALAVLLVVGLFATFASLAAEEEKDADDVIVTLAEVPAPVRATLEKESKGGKIEEIEKENEDGKTVYSADLVVDGKKLEVKVAADGKVLERESAEDEAKEGAESEEKEKESGEAEEAKEKDADEVAVKLSDVPAPARATLEKESQGGTIKELVRETEDGILVYSADIMKDGKASEVLVSPDGKVVKRESGDEEKDEAKESAEAGEKENESGEAEEAEEKHEAGEKEKAEWRMSFHEEKSDLGPTGRNDYFILEPGYVQHLEGKEGAKGTVLVITVLKETKVVDGVTTRVVEERESEDGQVVEVSRNYFAISKKTNNVYYFGEDSREYKNGKEVSRSGSWESGKNDARFGLMMPAHPKVGQRYYQEIAKKDEAMDRAVVESVKETVKVPAGSFESCLVTEESSAVEKGKEKKYYAPKVGLLIDGGLKLTKYGIEK